MEGGEQVAVYILGGDEVVVSSGLGGVDAGVVVGGDGHGGTGEACLALRVIIGILAVIEDAAQFLGNQRGCRVLCG